MGRIIIVLVALAFIALGGWAVTDVRSMVSLVGIVPGGPGSELELRAMYGGLEIGIGLFLLWCVSTRSTVRVGLMCVTATVGGMGLTRLVGIVMDPFSQPSLQLLLATAELATMALASIELFRQRGT